jgi:hypothetical protein
MCLLTAIARVPLCATTPRWCYARGARIGAGIPCNLVLLQFHFSIGLEEPRYTSLVRGGTLSAFVLLCYQIKDSRSTLHISYKSF